MSGGAQADLFGPRDPREVALARLAPAPRGDHGELERVAAALPDHVRLGTSSWSFPGWEGLVWARRPDKATAARDGLAAYSEHPLMRSVGVDRTFYAPVVRGVYEGWRQLVPEGFRFLVKAPEGLTTSRFPMHARYGARRGQASPHLLDPAYAVDRYVGPAMEGLRERLGVLLLLFSPQDGDGLGGPRRFPERLHRFLTALPKGPTYAVEVRVPQLLGPRYAEALRDTGAVHSLSVHPALPPPSQQLPWVDPAGPLVVRWMLHPAMTYAAAVEAFRPFEHVQRPDLVRRRGLAGVVAQAAAAGREVTVIVNNKAEGCSPESVEALAGEIADRLEALDGPPDG